MSVIFIYLGIYSYVLNDTLWENERSFLSIEVLHFGNVLFAENLAGIYLDEKRYVEAEKLYVVALDAFPKNANTYINYSALLIDTRRADDAIKYLNKAKSLVMTNYTRCEWFNNMGVACDRLKQKECAQNNFAEAVKYCPDEAMFKKNLQAVIPSH